MYYHVYTPPLVYPDRCSLSVAAVSCSEYWSDRVDYWNDVYGVYCILCVFMCKRGTCMHVCHMCVCVCACVCVCVIYFSTILSLLLVSSSTHTIV